MDMVIPEKSHVRVGASRVIPTMTEPQKVKEEDRLQESAADGQDDPTLSAVRSVMGMPVRPSNDAGAAAPRAELHQDHDERYGAPPEGRPVAGQERKLGRAALPELEPQGVEADEPARAADGTESGPRPTLARLMPGVPRRGWIFNRKVAIMFVLAGVVWWRPWLIPGLVFLTIWLALVVYLTVGPDRLAELVEPLKRRFVTRFPDRADAIRKRAQAGSGQLARLVEKLPERWRDGIEVPEFGVTSQSEADLEDRPDPFDRLAAERERDLSPG